jgi:hypothetical protein
VDAVWQDLQINSIRWRSWDGELHYQLVFLLVSIGYCIGSELDTSFRHLGTFLSGKRSKKVDVAEHPEVLDHVGLLTNEPPGTTELLSI